MCFTARRDAIKGVIKTGSDSKRALGEGVKFERTRRITGYLVGSLNRFNNAKRKEEQERVKHTFVLSFPPESAEKRHHLPDGVM
jgi:Oxygen-sensitive ribonucleoside-triphosphate reductase